MKTRLIFDCGCCIPFSKTEFRAIKTIKGHTYKRVCKEHGGLLISKKAECDNCHAVFEANKRSNVHICRECGFKVDMRIEKTAKRKRKNNLVLNVKTCILCGEEANTNYGNGMCTRCYHEEMHNLDYLIYQSFCEKVAEMRI